MLYLAKLTVRARERTFFGDELHDDAIQKMRARINSVLTHIRYLVYILTLRNIFCVCEAVCWRCDAAECSAQDATDAQDLR